MTIKMDDRPLVALIKKMDGDIDDWLRGVAESIVTDVKVSMGTSPRGRAYRRGKKIHFASVAGYPPNVDTGTLRASIRVVKKGNRKFWVVAGGDYAEELELGSSRIAPRPYIRPVFEAWRERTIADSLRAWLKR